MTTDRNDPCVDLAHQVRNALSCERGLIIEAQSTLGKMLHRMQGTMDGLQALIDQARLEIHLIDPAGTFEIRSDAAGDGAFGASRRSGNHQYTHRGLDTLVTPGDTVRSPMSGVVERMGLCYAEEEYRLLVIHNWPWDIKVLYINPLEGIVGQQVRQGQIIGHAQNIVSFPGRQYDVQGMRYHLHTEVRQFGDLVDPAPLMGIA